jgi:hypothetical protein
MARAPRRLALVAAAVVVMALIVPAFINVNHYRAQIAGALGRALGREVTIGSVQLRLLPEPGFQLHEVIISDDPSFSAEPMLRAREVTATLRLTSLWRGRFEVARLSFQEPSLNLVRRADGDWNILALLARAQQTPSAPTARKRPEQRPRFPYVEADNGRINFKTGVEKRVYALTDADFALWLAAEDEWRARLDARPVRIDADLSDTGRIAAEGWFERRAQVAGSALHVRMRWRDAQLGQLSTLLYGRDRGWRGRTALDLEANGTARELALRADASVDQFRRYDITPASALNLAAHCTALLHVEARALRGLDCRLPTGNGAVSTTGNIEQIGTSPRYDLKFTATNVPTAYAVAFAHRAKKDLADDLAADGTIKGELGLRTREDGAREWSGGGETSTVRLRSGALDPPVEITPVHFAVPPTEIAPAKPPRGRRAPPQPAPAAPFRLVLQPFSISLGRTRTMQARAELSGHGYEVDLAGTAELPRLLEVGRALGLRAPAAVSSGAARVDLAVAGGWAGFVPPVITGMADVASVTAEVPWIAAPLKIASARIALAPTEVAAQDIVASTGPLAFRASFVRPRGCAPGADCAVQFSLSTEQVALDDLNRLLNPRLRSEPWYRRLAGGGSDATSAVMRFTAHGRVNAARLLVKNVTAQNVSADVQLAPGVVALSKATAQVLGGNVSGEWRGEFGGAAPSYSGSGSADRIQMAQLAAVMGDGWAAGTLHGSWRLTLSGWDARELVRSAAGSLDFDWRDGTLRHLTLAAASSEATVAAGTPAAPLRLVRFAGRATLRGSVLTLEQSRMETRDGIYTVSGTASAGRALALRFAAPAHTYEVGGTLAEPRVEASAVTGERPPGTR